MSEKPWASFIVGQFGSVIGVLAILGLLFLSFAWVVWAFKVFQDMLARFPQ